MASVRCQLQCAALDSNLHLLNTVLTAISFFFKGLDFLQIWSTPLNMDILKSRTYCAFPHIQDSSLHLLFLTLSVTVSHQIHHLTPPTWATWSKSLKELHYSTFWSSFQLHISMKSNNVKENLQEVFLQGLCMSMHVYQTGLKPKTIIFPCLYLVSCKL